jgi:hypothetical protein
MEYNGGLMVLKFISMNMYVDGSAVPFFTNVEFNSGPLSEGHQATV